MLGSRISLLPCRRRFGRDTRASTALQFALALPVLGAMGGVAIDFANAMSLKSKLQQIADSAALGAAREIRLGNTTDASVQAAVSQNVTAMSSTLKNVSSVSATSTLSSDRTTVKVDLTGNSSSTFAALTGVSIGTVKVSATARMMGGAPLCFMSLNLTASNAMQMDQNAQLTANNCAVYSNSNHRNSISIKNSARVTAATICAAGGVTVHNCRIRSRRAPRRQSAPAHRTLSW
jgi:Flp pilus assembly protein TadG